MYLTIRLAFVALACLAAKAQADPDVPTVFNISSFQASATDDNKIK